MEAGQVNIYFVLAYAGSAVIGSLLGLGYLRLRVLQYLSDRRIDKIHKHLLGLVKLALHLDTASTLLCTPVNPCQVL